MSYAGMGYGSYYEFTPHQVYSGMGGCGGCGCVGGCNGYGCYGYGAAEPAYVLDVDAVMANIAKSDVCYGPGGACADFSSAACKAAAGGCNWAGQKANKEIAAALNALGYGPIPVDGTISWKGAYARFLSDHNLTKGPGFGITRQALLAMKRDLEAGEKPGPAPPVEYEKVNGEHVPKTPGGKAAAARKEEEAARAGMGGAEWLLAALVVGGAGYLVYRAGKKKKGAGKKGKSQTASMKALPPAKMKANRRRRRRRRR